MASPRKQLLRAALATFGLALGVGQASAATGLQTCLAECKRANLSVTNRASCRLDCETDAASDPEVIRARMAAPSRPAAPRVSPPASGGTTVAAARDPGCKPACDADTTLSEDDRATCKLECDLEPAPMPTGTPPPMRPPRPQPAGTTPATAAAAPTIAAPAPGQAGFLGKCHATCKPGRTEREATDYETCKLDCATMASVLDVAVTLVPDAWMASPAIATNIEPVAPAVVTPTPRPAARPRAAPANTGLATCGPNLQTCRDTCVKTEAKCNRSCGRKHVSETDRETCKLGCGTDQEVCQGDCLTATATCVSDNSAPRGG